jgi:hypothetical protein
MKNKIIPVFVLTLLVLTLSSVSAYFTSYSGSSSSFVNYQQTTSFQNYYGSDAEKYWPILNEKDNSCVGRQDLLLQVSPGGCQPMVVRSDLLEEQNVPVFCSIDALQINPLIDIKEFKSLSFSSYPSNIAGVGFHPARAALNTRDTLLGDPLINNVGYVVIMVKKTPLEKDMPESINVNLTANIEYNAGNAYGVGRAEFYLTPVNEEDWMNYEKEQQTFLRGQYSIRLEDADSKSALISIYRGDLKVASQRVEMGKSSGDIWLPGSYCRFSYKINYVGLVSAEESVRLEVSDSKGTDTLDLYRGSSFLDGKCTVRSIDLERVKDSKGVDQKDSNGNPQYTGFGKVTIGCSGVNKNIVLSLAQKETSLLAGKEITMQEKNLFCTVKMDDGYFYGIHKTPNNLGWELVKSSSESSKFSDYTPVSIGSDYKLAGLRAEMTKECSQWNVKGNKKIVLGTSSTQSSTNLVFSDSALSDSTSEAVYNDAIESYKQIAKEYPAEKPTREGVPYGESAIDDAVKLSGYNSVTSANKISTKAELLNLLMTSYPSSSRYADYQREYNQLFTSDTSTSVSSVVINNKNYNFNLVKFSIPKEKSKAKISYAQGISSEQQEGENYPAVPTASKTGMLHHLVLQRVIDENNARFDVYCKSQDSAGKETVTTESSVDISLGETVRVCGGTPVRLDGVQLKRIAKVRIEPEVRTSTKTNLSVSIGIEKRAIQLSPDKTLTRIQTLNESIKKWESISKNLGNVVKTMKGACFATSAGLLVKNFVGNINGGAIARDKAMKGPDGWEAKCKTMIEQENKYKTLTECYNDNSRAIEEDVNKWEESVSEVNSKIQGIESPLKTGDTANGYEINTADAYNQMLKDLKQQYPNEPFLQNCNEITKTTSSACSYSDLRDWYALQSAKQKGIDVSGSLKSIEERIGKQRKDLELVKNAAQNDPSSTIRTKGATVSTKVYEVSADGKTIGGASVEGLQSSDIGPNKYAFMDRYSGNTNTGQTAGAFTPGDYFVIGEKTATGILAPQSVYKAETVTTNGKNSYKLTKVNEKIDAYTSLSGMGPIKVETGGFIGNNPITAPVDKTVRYFETGPDKGMPSYVPFDVANGWYAKVKSNMNIGNQLPAYDSSGLPKVWWICNVKENGGADSYDPCGQVVANVNLGSPILGLDQKYSDILVEKSRNALMSAAAQKGNRVVNIEGQQFEVGAPTSQYDDVQCQDFMSPDDCKILFNVCDPVICPASRCNLGGAYPVSDVIQTGIVGSALLCLPNAREGVLMPVCLTGIQAGLDSYISVMKNHRDCLQANLESGKMIGICDQLYSIYLCEFFWRQAAPLANIIIPKIIEAAYGNSGARGGGEYLSVQAAWDKAGKSVDYFTQIYAVNSMKAFNARSTEDVGSQFCKGFISAKGPSSFESLIEPDSPTQFYASFDSIPFTSATVPATSNYKVFYHIYAGKDAGTYYSVYLKSPPQSNYYINNPSIQVASGFIAKGEYKSETRDFTAPEGYKELCVRINDEEHCGFKQVSTDFAINQIRDSYVASEIKNNNIQTESACISGSSNIGSMVNLNAQAGAEETAFPSIADRGIVRICSTTNPGLSTNPSRYTDVGYCGDPNVRCYLDKNSVNNAITSNNLGLKNETYNELETQQIDKLVASGQILSNDVAQAKINAIKTELEGSPVSDKSRINIKGLGSGTTVADANTKVSAYVQKIDSAFGKDLELVFLNHHKAEILLLKARIKAALAQVYLDDLQAKINAQPQPSTPSNTNPSQNAVSQIYYLDNGGNTISVFYENGWKWSLKNNPSQVYSLTDSMSGLSASNQAVLSSLRGLDSSKGYELLKQKALTSDPISSSSSGSIAVQVPTILSLEGKTPTYDSQTKILSVTLSSGIYGVDENGNLLSYLGGSWNRIESPTDAEKLIQTDLLNYYVYVQVQSGSSSPSSTNSADVSKDQIKAMSLKQLLENYPSLKDETNYPFKVVDYKVYSFEDSEWLKLKDIDDGFDKSGNLILSVKPDWTGTITFYVSTTDKSKATLIAKQLGAEVFEKKTQWYSNSIYYFYIMLQKNDVLIVDIDKDYGQYSFRYSGSNGKSAKYEDELDVPVWFNRISTNF